MEKKKIFRNMNRCICISWLLCCFACNSWLDITPEAQVNEKKMFETPEGFQSVVNGIYVIAAKDNLYGGELTWRLPDVMAQYYDIYQTSHTYYAVNKFDYAEKQIKPKVESIWKELYFCIANCNILLQNLDKVNPDFFTEDYHYNMIKGEALALRAFFHLDLLRLYAPAPIVKKNVLAIPYVEVYSNQITPHAYTQDVLTKIIRDLKAARELLKTGDPIYFDRETFKNKIYKFTQPYHYDYFASYRAYRMNYYAVTGLLARAYAYRNEGDDLKQASECALEIMDCGLFPFVEESEVSKSDADSRDAIFSSELIGCFGSGNLAKTFETYTATGGDNTRLPLYYPDEIFYGESEDYRMRYLVVENTKYEYITLKYKINNKIPFIRLSEMYYIQAQYLGKTSLKDAQEILEQLRRKRGLNGSLDSRITKEEELIKEIVKDAQKEFLAEGQAFYMFKRFNLPVLKGNAAVTMKAEDYVLPIPDVELEFGDRLSNLLK